MSEEFDPYHEWLGIPASEQPPHHYRLLAIQLFEENPTVIENAADQRMAHLRTFQAGKHAAHSQLLLNEVATAKLCLLNPEKKTMTIGAQFVELDGVELTTSWLTTALSKAKADKVVEALGIDRDKIPEAVHRIAVKQLSELYALDPKIQAVKTVPWQHSCGGILTEVSGEQDEIDWVVVGVGINVNTEYGELPVPLRRTAASLKIAGGRLFDRSELLAHVLLSLEASYVAQGQANRAQEIRRALETYKQLSLQHYDDHSAIGLTALVTLAGEDDTSRTFFIGPLEGGMKLVDNLTGMEIVVITPASPLGRDLIGRGVGDPVRLRVGTSVKEFEIARIC